MTASNRQLGLVMATALVLGNMIGSGVFLLPASLAPYGGFSLVGWLISAVGALLLAGVFCRLARRAPRAGGPYAYSREAFGDCIGFLVAWTYWVSGVVGLAAIAVAFASYLSVFFPAMGAHPLSGALTALAAVWIIVAVNIAGVRQAGALQVATTALKLLPLIALALFGLFHFNPQLLTPGPHAGSPWHAVNISVTATLFAFAGVECASIPAGHVRDPERTIPRATLLGTAIAAIVYIACSAAVMGLVPASELARSQAPLADAGRVLWGPWAAWLIAGAAAVSCFGALNGWILITGQFSQAVARDDLFPRCFGRESARSTPATGLLVLSAFVSIMVLANYSGGMVAMFTFLVLLATLATVVAYLFSALADVLLAHRSGCPLPVRDTTLAFAAFGFMLWAVIGAGTTAAYWTFVLLLAGLPLYVWKVVSRRRAGPVPTGSEGRGPDAAIE